MSVIHRYCAMPALFLIAAFLTAGCTNDTITSTPGKEPAASMPAPTASTADTPVDPAVTTPSAPAANIPAEPQLPSPSESTTTKPGEPKTHDQLTLKPGQSGSVDASTKLHYVRMVNDSRCPPDVQCIWAGEVTIELLLESGKEKQSFTMKDDGKATSILGYSIELVSIDRSHLILVRVKKI